MKLYQNSRMKNNKMNRTAQKKDGYVLQGISLFYTGFLIILPVLAITVKAFQGGGCNLWENITLPQASHALILTFAVAAIMVIINVITGTATAWVLVRYRFPLKNLMNSMIDLPFAIPTVVTGVMLVVLYGPKGLIGGFLEHNGMQIIFEKPAILLALLYVTFPFVVRSVQPVLLEMERDMEEAAKTLGATPSKIFFKIVMPTLTPAIITGAALSFSRAMGEFGSIAIVAGNIPFKTQVASVYIYGELESNNQQGALGVSVFLLLCSLFILILLNIIKNKKRTNEN